jgi:hypothetical protein
MTDETKVVAVDAVSDAPSDAWMPTAPGDQLVGEVVDVDMAWSDYRNGYYPVLTVRTDDGVELKLHAFRTVLFNEVVKWQPVVGERIIVTYLGAGKAKAGMSAPHIYKLRIEGRSGMDARSVYRRLQAPAPRPTPEPGVPVDITEAEPLPF